jgi:hypothetical protein
MENHPAKHFALQLGSLASLYLSLAFLIVLIFGAINIIYPDAIDGAWQIENASSSIRLGIAMVMVFYPTYLILTRLVNKNRRREKQGTYLGLTKWLIYLSLLVGGAVLLGDLVAIITSFLEGGITQRFILKAVTVLVIVGSAFTYYVYDARGYWLKNEKKSILFASFATLVVIASLIFGFLNINPPSEVREEKLDNQMAGQLQDIQWRIEDYYLTNSTLPEDLETLYKSFTVPTPPEKRNSYEYKITGEKSYELCATFSRDSSSLNISHTRPGLEKNYNWDHQAGYWCFERDINNVYPQQLNSKLNY